MDWITPLGDTTFSVAGWTSPFTLAALGLAFGGLVVTGMLGRGLGRPIVAVGVLAGTVLAVVVAVAVPFSLWAAQGGSGAETLATALFGREIRREVAGAAGTIVLVGLGAAVWAAARPAEGWPWVRAGIGAFSLGGALLGVAHATWVIALGPFPAPAAELPARMHVGQRVDADVRIDVYRAERWAHASVTLAPAVPGVHDVVLAAWRPGARAERTVTYEAGEDRADPLMPLLPGARWAYVQSTSWHSHFLWFIDAPGEAEGPRITLTVTAERVERGLHVAEVERREDTGVEHWTVYGWNGQTWWVDESGAARPFLHRLETDADGSIACNIEALASWSCRCVATPPGGPLALPGPARCSRDTGGVVSALASAFVAIVTVGLVIEDPNRHHTLEVVESGRVTSPGSPPEPRSTPAP